MKRRTQLALVALALVAAASHAAEPFYVTLLEAGGREYLRGDYAGATHKLRIACFGLLDEPQLLTAGLIRLALAEAGAGDDRGFHTTFDRIVEVESTFGSYRALTPGTPFKAEFERLLAERFSAEELELIPAFAGIAARLRDAKLAALPPKRLRNELERRLAADPRDGEALVLLTRLEIAQNRPQKAETRLGNLVADDPENRMARCLWGQMKLRRDDCAGAMEDLSWCRHPPTDEVLGPRYLRCLVEAADWQAAGGFLAALPLELRRREEVVNLILAIPPATLASLARAPSVVDEAVTMVKGAEEADAVAELRRQLAAASSSAELEDVYTRLSARAGERPQNRQLQYLAGEAAYRRADWESAVEHFRRGGPPGTGRPLLSFYFAVALFETGEAQAAAETLRPVLPALEPTPFVEGYRERILAAASPS